MKMEIVLTQELEQFVKAKVRSGRYADASEVVREALKVVHRVETLAHLKFEIEEAQGEIRIR